MELLRTESHYIFVKERYSLWCDKQTGELSSKSDWEWASTIDIECLGICYGIVGKIEQSSVLESRLILIKEIAAVGELHRGHVVNKIKSIAFLQLGVENQNIGLLACKKHQHFPKNKLPGKQNEQKTSFSKTWGSIKSATNTIKNTTQQAAALATSQVKSTVINKYYNKEKDKFEKRLLEEFNKIFTETDSFYFCATTDITNSLQRRSIAEQNEQYKDLPLWRKVDDRFFWNKHMLKDLIDINASDCWILPVIQGYIQIEQCKVETGYDSQPQFETFNLAIISRRCRFRAGTRYKRRGVDEDGKCANYVETEQLVWYHDHQVSFVQVRGSVPVFWSQPGYKYRPPPRIDKDEAETQVAFEKHFSEELECYGPICIVNLVEQNGKEKIIWDVYSNHVLSYNNPNITYTTFDFHEYCRGMHFENVSILVSALAAVLSEMGYCWRDERGIICMQSGVFRVNCIDCLDRTNVVQTALGKTVMEMQFSKLGLIPPDGALPSNIRQTFQSLWANNGDIISKQYAGTNALKGDYTRTGERKLTGMMKDGMNSANRYLRQHFLDGVRQTAINVLLGYPFDPEGFVDSWSDYLNIIDNCCSELIPATPPKIPINISSYPEILYAQVVYDLTRYYVNRFKDAYRQATIDIMLGNSLNEELFQEKTEEEDNAATAIHVKLLIEDCKKLLINNPDNILGSWGLIDADPVTGDPTETEMDKILILTHDSYYVADFDDQIDKVTNYQRVNLSDIDSLEFGQPETTVSLFKNKNQYCIRINYKVDNEAGYFHMFRSTNLRFFNNMAVVIKTEEEIIESLKAIVEAIVVAMEIATLPKVSVFMNINLDKRKSKIVNDKKQTGFLDISFPDLTRNVSETQLHALKSVGTKAISNVTEQFSKLNKLSHTLTGKKSIPLVKSLSKKESVEKPVFTLGSREISSNSNDKSSSCSDSEENISTPQVFLPKPENFERDTKLMEGYTPKIGIIMGMKNDVVVDDVPKENFRQGEQAASMERSTPAIKIDGDRNKMVPPDTLNFNRTSGQSSLSTDSAKLCDKKRSASARDLVLNISTSQSESALKTINLGNPGVTSPIAMTTKELLSPFSKLAKGVQSLGANLDPRKLKGGSISLSRNLSDNHLEQRQKLQDRWVKCNSKLIAL